MALTTGQFRQENGQEGIDSNIAQEKCAEQKIPILSQRVNGFRVFGIIRQRVRLDDDLSRMATEKKRRPMSVEA